MRGILGLAAGVLMVMLPQQAVADKHEPVKTGADTFVLKVRNQRASARAGARPGSADASRLSPAQREAAYRKRVAAAIEANENAIDAAQKCRAAATGASCAYVLVEVPPNAPGGGSVTGHNLASALSPQQAAYFAVARIHLTAPKPMIGPSPDLNPWKMAAVGYPLWLWADGTLNPAPVTDTVEDISVSLDAHLVKVVFDLGDGHKLSCTDLTTEWTTAVKPGTPSPACGYRYQQPSLPAGSYTVTANAVWAIDWTVNGTTGTIPFYQSASTTIPVGELQVLTR